jgi:Rps23 Pro-64 3,4-dihydroxylase Tpa1-like proline 4-hydroxylase
MVMGKILCFFMSYVLLTVHLDNFCNENQLDALSLLYFVRHPLHVSGVFIVLYCVVLYVHSDWCVIHLADC